jgi:hypothetical protein
MSIMMNTANLIPSTTHRLLAGGQQLSAAGSRQSAEATFSSAEPGPDLLLFNAFETFQGNPIPQSPPPAPMGLNKAENPFNILDPGSLYNLNPMVAVQLATSIGGLPPQLPQSSQGSLLGPDILNNITPMNAIALAQALAGPLIAPLQQSGLMA